MNAFSGFGPAIAAGRSGYGAVSMAVASGRVQLVTIRQESLSLARWRLLWVALGFVFVTLLALVRIGYLGASDNGARGTSLAEAACDKAKMQRGPHYTSRCHRPNHHFVCIWLQRAPEYLGNNKAYQH